MLRNTLLSLLLIIGCLFLDVSCKNKDTKQNVMPADSVADIIADLVIIDSYIDLNKCDEQTAIQMYCNYFNKENINFERFDSSLKYYYRKTDKKLPKLDEEVLKRIYLKESEINNQ